MIQPQRPYSKSISAKPDSLIKEKVFVITLSQMRAINEKAILLDSLTKRYNEMILNTQRTIDQAEKTAHEAFEKSEQIDKKNSQILAIEKKEKRKLWWQVAWQKAQKPILIGGAFLLGNYAYQLGFTLKL